MEISASLGLDRKTVRKYLVPRSRPGWSRTVAGSAAGDDDQDWCELAGAWFPAVVDAGLLQVTWPAIEVHRDTSRPSSRRGDAGDDPLSAGA